MTTAIVAICTRNRPRDLLRAVRAVLRSSVPGLEVLVIDQSDPAGIAGLPDDARLDRIWDGGRGSARAHNLALRLARSEIVVYTDDDCEPEGDWLRPLLVALGRVDGPAIAFGSVIPAPIDPKLGYIDGYVPPARRELRGRLSKLRDGGIGANMAVRRGAVLDVGGFDEQLGPGGYFSSTLDGDLAYRVLRAGHAIAHVPESRVVHHGVRGWAESGARSRATFTGIAAAYTKYLRLGDPVAALLLGQQVGFALANVARHAAARERPLGLGRLAALLAGIARSFELGVDPATARYRPPRRDWLLEGAPPT